MGKSAWLFLKRVFRSREVSTLTVLILLATGIFLEDKYVKQTNAFLSPYNLQNLSRQIGLLTIMGLGETFVIITGGIDLSMGSLIAFIGVAASCLLTPAPPPQFLAFRSLLSSAIFPKQVLETQTFLSSAILPILCFWLAGLVLCAFIRGAWARRVLVALSAVTGLAMVFWGFFVYVWVVSLGLHGVIRRSWSWQLLIVSLALAGLVIFLWGLSSLAPNASPAVVVPLILVLCVLIGVYHGVLVAYVHLPPFVVTLGSMCILRGCAMLLTESIPVMIEDNFFQHIGNENVAGVPIPFAVCGVLVIVMAVLMRMTAFGRQLFAVGGNELATYYSGINVARVKIGAYVLCAVLGGIAALLYAGYDRQGNPSTGAFYELNAIAAAVVGGASLMGGEGSIIGTFFGAGILQVILNGINLIVRQASSLWEGVIVGLVVVAAVTFNTLRARRV